MNKYFRNCNRRHTYGFCFDNYEKSTDNYENIFSCLLDTMIIMKKVQTITIKYFHVC